MAEHRAGGRLQHHHRVVVDRAAAVGRHPVADHVDVDALRHVGRGGGHVARPGVGDPGLAAGHVGVVVVVDDQVDQAGQVLEGLPGQRDLLVVGGVEVEDAVLHQPQADALAVVVEDRDPAPVLGLPRHRPRVRHRVGVLVHQVLTPADPGRVDRVRDRVLPVLVVEGVGVVGPGLGDVRDVGVVQRLDQLALDELAHGVGGRADEDVVGEPAAQLGQRLVHRVEGGQLDLAFVFLREGVDAGLVDVRGPDEHLEGRVPLGREARLDRGVAGEDRPLHRIARPGQRQRARARQVRRAAGQRAARAERRERGQADAALEEPTTRQAVALPAFTRVYQRPSPYAGATLTECSVN